jgi:hypothetical protein
MAFRDTLSFKYCRRFIKQTDNKPGGDRLDWNARFHMVDCHEAPSTKNLDTLLAKCKSLKAIWIA